MISQRLDAVRTCSAPGRACDVFVDDPMDLPDPIEVSRDRLITEDGYIHWAAREI